MKVENTTEVSMPFAVFDSALNYINFVRDRVTNSLGEIRQKSIETYFLQNWPYPRGTSQTTNATLTLNLTQAVTLAKQLGLNTTIQIFTPVVTPVPAQNNINTINTVTPTCT
jgi:hypothetical protein